jgi:hypothetical protein
LSDHFRTLSNLLREQVRGPVCARLYAEARPRHPVLAVYPDLPALLAVLDQSTDDYTERDLITQALLWERMSANPSQWSAVLAVVFLPMLVRLRCHLVCVELPSDDLDQIVLEGFLASIASYRRESWRIRTPIRLTHLTRRTVFKVMRRELSERKSREQERELVQVIPGQIPMGSAASPPMGIRVEAVLEAIEDDVSEEGAFLLLETELGKENLTELVSRMSVDNEEDRVRLYERLKRTRSRAKKRLIDMIVKSPS